VGITRSDNLPQTRNFGGPWTSISGALAHRVASRIRIEDRYHRSSKRVLRL